GLVLTSSFQPEFDGELCVACEICIDRCPGSALTMGPADLPLLDLDRCFGCGVCATGCPEDAVAMVARTVAAPPPPDKKALKEALKAQQPA
ncbi:MAG: 4Fe-4S binding protein, partial [Pseudomonadota bacterium]